VADVVADHADHEFRDHSLLLHFVKAQFVDGLLGHFIGNVFGELPEIGGGNHRHLILEPVDYVQGVAAGDDCMELTCFQASAAVNAAVGVDSRFAVAHPDGLCGANPHAGGAAGAVVFQYPERVVVLCFLFIHLA